MTPKSEYQNLIETRGHRLERFGLSDVAFGRDDALLAVASLRNASIPLLGGDVYFKKATGFEPAYANWHSDPLPGETRNAFVMRSCLEAKNYIESFPPTVRMPVFVLVPLVTLDGV